MKGRGNGTWKVAGSTSKWKQVSSRRSAEEQGCEDVSKRSELEMSHNGETTVMLGGLPANLTPAQVLEVLDKDFELCYDFFYMPMDFQSFTTKSHAFINFRSPEKALECAKQFVGFRDWGPNAQSKMPCRASWAAVQGYDANIEKQRKSSHIHENIPEDCKPWVFGANGERLSTINIFMPHSEQSQKQPVNEMMHEKDSRDDAWWDGEWYGGQEKRPDGKSNEKRSAESRKIGIATWKKTVEKKTVDQRSSDKEGKQHVWNRSHGESQSWNGYTKKETVEAGKHKEDNYTWPEQEREFIWKPSLPRRKEPAEGAATATTTTEAEPSSQSGTVLKADDLFKSVIEAEMISESIPPTLSNPTVDLTTSAASADASASLSFDKLVGGVPGGARYACLNCSKCFAKWSACQHHMMHDSMCKQAVLGSDKQPADIDSLQHKSKEKALTTSTDSGSGIMRDEAILREVRRFQ
eukprot:TRINITY_DN80126_c0_g1_i1.p1 TRINITY_DN80126_c0_g1~~TRINITY_DN80126_c0_g1_i1.p1  ORF type:complete len:466 (+),score=71.39 TRINITY_DN80126_c0_g1_i1:161-1558(+)